MTAGIDNGQEHLQYALHYTNTLLVYFESDIKLIQNSVKHNRVHSMSKYAHHNTSVNTLNTFAFAFMQAY